MNKGINTNDIICAYSVLKGFVPYDDPDVCEEIATIKNPLDILLEKEKTEEKKKKFQSLSDEAKQVIQMVLNTPTEIVDLIFTEKLKKISKNKIALMLQRQWKDKKYVNKVISELEEYVKIL